MQKKFGFSTRRLFLLGVGGVLLLAGCQRAVVPSVARLQETQAAAAGSANDFIVVDCMLPGQVRKLGRMIYQTPRRPVKATRAECEVKGGEYVAYDRSDLNTALSVWMQKAVEGDAAAQTYVGEIYQKGVGREPKYDLAARWYAQAAEQGYGRAQFNLGYLYEQGLGVAKDSVKALNLYRKASGLKSAVVMESELLKERRQVEELKAELKRRKKESDTLRRELKQTREKSQQLLNEHETLRRSIRDKEKKMEATQARLVQLKAYGETDEVNELQEALYQRAAALKKEHRRAATLEERVHRLNQDADEYRAKLTQYRQQSEHLDQLRSDLEERTREIEALQQQLSQAQNEMALIRQTYTREQWRMDQEKIELKKARAELEALKTDQLEADKQKLGDLSARISERELKLAQQREASARLKSEVRRLSEEIEAYRTRLAAAKAQPEQVTGPKIQVIDPQLMATRGKPTASPVSVSMQSQQDIVGKVTAPAGLFYLRVNQRKQQIGENGLFNLSIPLSRKEDTVVDIVAVDLQGQSEAFSFVIPTQAPVPSPAPPSPKETKVFFGAYHALVIGNNAYENLPPLASAVNDAREIARVLQQKYGFKTKLLLNANRSQIYAALDGYRRELTEKDNFLVYYAGHGEIDKKNRRGYWLPVDADPESHINSIPNYTVTDILNIMSVKQAIIISDACYSGIMTRAVVVRQEIGLSTDKRRQWLEQIAQKKSRTVLTSGGIMPVLDAGVGNHSIFAKSLLDLLDQNREILAADRIYRKIRPQVMDISNRLGFKQIPEYAANLQAGHESGDFLFVPVGMQKS